MAKNLRISEELFHDLADEAKIYGFQTIEELLIEWKNQMANLKHRKEIFDEVMTIHAGLRDKYGCQSDSTTLIRQDRDR